MLLLLHPRRLSAPVPKASADTATWTEGSSVPGPLATDTVTWYSLQFPNKRPKRNTLLSTWTSGIPPRPADERRLTDEA